MTVLVFFSLTCHCQEIKYGKYRLCYDMYWRCHFQNLLELRPDSTYEFTYLDDTQMRKSDGIWWQDSNFVFLNPLIIPDKVVITYILETSKISLTKNLLSISEASQGIPNLTFNYFVNGKKQTVETDSIGEYHYEGMVLDSLNFNIQGKELKVISIKKNIPSIIRIGIDTNHKDLVYQQLGTNRIRIRNGNMLVEYIDDENNELKTEFFVKIK